MSRSLFISFSFFFSSFLSFWLCFLNKSFFVPFLKSHRQQGTLCLSHLERWAWEVCNRFVCTLHNVASNGIVIQIAFPIYGVRKNNNNLYNSTFCAYLNNVACDGACVCVHMYVGRIFTTLNNVIYCLQQPQRSPPLPTRSQTLKQSFIKTMYAFVWPENVWNIYFQSFPIWAGIVLDRLWCWRWLELE